MTRAHGRAELPGLDGYWSRLSDEELLAISFSTSDPENLPGLVHALPPPEPLPIVEQAYDFRGTTTQDCVASNVIAQSTLQGSSLKPQTNAGSWWDTTAAK